MADQRTGTQGWEPSELLSPTGPFDDDAALRRIRGRVTDADEMYDAAVFVYRSLYVTKRYGPGSGRTQRDLANDLGLSPPYVTRLKRLGRALFVHGVPKESRLWTQLVTRADERDVGRAPDSDHPVPHEVLLALLAGGPPERAQKLLRSPLSHAYAGADMISEALEIMHHEEIEKLRVRVQKLMSEIERQKEVLASDV